MCGQRRHKSACASAQSDLSLHCLHEETLHPWLSKIPSKDSDQTLNTLGTHVRWYGFGRFGAYSRTAMWLNGNTLAFSSLRKCFKSFAAKFQTFFIIIIVSLFILTIAWKEVNMLS